MYQGSDAREFGVRRREALGVAIARAREAVGGSAGRLGQEDDVAEGVVVAWEAGDADPTLEQIVGVEVVLGLTRGELGGEAGYFGFEAMPWCAEAVASQHFFESLDDAVAAVEAADVLGMGVRLRSQLRPDDDDRDAGTMEWVVDLLAATPTCGDPDGGVGESSVWGH